MIKIEDEHQKEYICDLIWSMCWVIRGKLMCWLLVSFHVLFFSLFKTEQTSVCERERDLTSKGAYCATTSTPYLILPLQFHWRLCSLRHHIYWNNKIWWWFCCWVYINRGKRCYLRPCHYQNSKQQPEPHLIIWSISTLQVCHSSSTLILFSRESSLLIWRRYITAMLAKGVLNVVDCVL